MKLRMKYQKILIKMKEKINMSKLISGKEVSLKVKNQVAEETAELKKQ